MISLRSEFAKRCKSVAGYRELQARSLGIHQIQDFLEQNLFKAEEL